MLRRGQACLHSAAAVLAALVHCCWDAQLCLSAACLQVWIEQRSALCHCWRPEHVETCLAVQALQTGPLHAQAAARLRLQVPESAPAVLLLLPLLLLLVGAVPA